MGDFQRFQDWPRTCNNSESSGHREGSARRIRLIPRVVKQDQISVSYPLFGGRRIYVSFVRTIHGGSRCYCSYPASRSLCCFSLGLSCRNSLRIWFPHRPQSLSGRIEAEVRLRPGLFPFKASRDTRVSTCPDGELSRPGGQETRDGLNISSGIFQ